MRMFGHQRLLNFLLQIMMINFEVKIDKVVLEDDVLLTIANFH